MKRNRLLQPYPLDSARCTGRTTAIALYVLARAIAEPGSVRYAVDHHEPGTQRSAENLKSRIDRLVEDMRLQHMRVQIVRHGDTYQGHVRVSSEIWGE